MEQTPGADTEAEQKDAESEDHPSPNRTWTYGDIEEDNVWGR